MSSKEFHLHLHANLSAIVVPVYTLILYLVDAIYYLRGVIPKACPRCELETRKF
jgi:hypothetical protein